MWIIVKGNEKVFCWSLISLQVIKDKFSLLKDSSEFLEGFFIFLS